MCLLDIAQNPKYDTLIRAALLKADQNGKLSRVSSIVGIAGGADALRRIYKSEGKLHLMDRAMIGMHLKNI